MVFLATAVTVANTLFCLRTLALSSPVKPSNLLASVINSFKNGTSSMSPFITSAVNTDPVTALAKRVSSISPVTAS